MTEPTNCRQLPHYNGTRSLLAGVNATKDSGEIESPSSDQGSTALASDPLHFRFGKFEVLEAYTKGSAGTVYRARDAKLNQLVALKVMNNCVQHDPEEVQRFKAALEYARRLTHPGIVPILECDELLGMPYFTMQLVDSNLRSWISQRQPTDLHVATAMESVAKVLHFLHENDLIHGNLKPSNVLMTHEGQPLLADLGFGYVDFRMEGATVEERLDAFAYCAPEQVFRAAELKPAVDIWAVGVILYELLTGRLPFTHPQREEFFGIIQYESPESPRSIVNDLDPRLERIVLRCLEKLPSDRYPTAMALAEDLAQWKCNVSTRRNGP